MLDSGAHPQAMDTMTLGEIESMVKALLRRRDKGDGTTDARHMTDEEYDAMIESIRAMNMPDVRV